MGSIMLARRFLGTWPLACFGRTGTAIRAVGAALALSLVILPTNLVTFWAAMGVYKFGFGMDLRPR